MIGIALHPGAAPPTWRCIILFPLYALLAVYQIALFYVIVGYTWRRYRPPTPTARVATSRVAEALVASYAADAPLVDRARATSCRRRARSTLALTELRELLFPGFTGGATSDLAACRCTRTSRRALAQVRVRLTEQVYRGLHHRCRVAGAECAACQQSADAHQPTGSSRRCPSCARCC